MKNCRLYIIILAALSLPACQPTENSPSVYRDFLKPGGVARGDAAFEMDAGACEVTATALQPAYSARAGYDADFDACMRSKGWRADE